MSDERQYETRHPGWAKRRRQWEVALDNFDRSGLAFVPQPSTVIIKGDADFQILKKIYFKGDTKFASSAVYIKGDTSLIAERTTLIKGDTKFATFAVYFKGDAALAENIPLPNLGENPPSTKPGAISRFWLQINSVKKDVT
jgi:hypothetical protein